MNKDALLATVIGFIIGLFITALLLAGPRLAAYLPHINIKWPSIAITKAKPTPKATPTPASFTITIDSPLDQSIESESEILVSGTTAAGSTVVIQGNTGDTIAEVKNDGKYAGKVTLVEGENEITVTSFLKDKSATQTVTVFYTTENL